MNIVTRTLIIIIFVASLILAIIASNNEIWLTIWFILFIFLGIPLSLLALKDIIIIIAPKCLGSSQILLHICAIFGAVIGYYLGVMAVETGHEKADIHQLMVVIFPVLVYLTPLLMVLNGVPLSEIKYFYFKFDRK